jgi:hypothetical protein
MAKRKRNRKPPQARHGKKSTRSRHDKRKRLDTPNPERRSTQTAKVPLLGLMAVAVGSMARLLDPRSGFRLSIIFAGAMLATGRRTASSWFTAAGVQDDWDRFYDLLGTVGKKTATLTTPLLQLIFGRFDPGPGGYWMIAIDDSPTKRYGRYVEAANVHHNPTPGPADGQWLYGHCWVCLAILAGHPLFGVIALSVLSRLYVRKEDVARLKQRYAWEFRTKLELAQEMIFSVTGTLRALGSQAKFMVIFDGAYAKRPLVKPLVDRGMTVVSRLRHDAKLFDLPGPPSGKPGRKRIYGKKRVYLKTQAARAAGWRDVGYSVRGVETGGRCKDFVVTSPMVSGAIRVVLLEHPGGKWAAYFSTDISLTAEEILSAVGDRWAIEEHFHDVKEVWGAGEQQVRNVWSNIACWNLCGWLYTLVELACWESSAEELVDRSDRPWDNPSRRPSHADRRRHLAGKMLRNELKSVLPPGPEAAKISEAFELLLSLAA